MFLQRSAVAVARRAAFRPAVQRTFTTSFIRNAKASKEPTGQMKKLEEITSEEDLLPPGAARGTVPTDLEQSTGLERLEILGKMQGIDIFDMKPLDSSRKGTLDHPIVVKSFGDEQYAGCTGYPADSHVVHWLTMSRDRPVERCPECGNVLKMEYVGPQDDGHGHHGHDEHTDGAHHYEGEPKTFADFVKPEYRNL
ncbi:cytochrome c oxidase polypeptide IV mitochondrial precursor [Lepidopterella palustris CBS 459.81]|uniref:Cytochrome c oxidase subunit 4, mitochondrial n=1 Tax=Lepidopterella palustris CBS 459.81 TaxID=1314670 RepID=A0A8E2EG53_9PEZI|nr:cytochrome c oxidase polypeptide IV mitochondrial precursor [Lepidopterella palustris CBS 459.81]